MDRITELQEQLQQVTLDCYEAENRYQLAELQLLRTGQERMALQAKHEEMVSKLNKAAKKNEEMVSKLNRAAKKTRVPFDPWIGPFGTEVDIPEDEQEVINELFEKEHLFYVAEKEQVDAKFRLTTIVGARDAMRAELDKLEEERDRVAKAFANRERPTSAKSLLYRRK